MGAALLPMISPPHSTPHMCTLIMQNVTDLQPPTTKSSLSKTKPSTNNRTTLQFACNLISTTPCSNSYGAYVVSATNVAIIGSTTLALTTATPLSRLVSSSTTSPDLHPSLDPGSASCNRTSTTPTSPIASFTSTHLPSTPKTRARLAHATCLVSTTSTCSCSCRMALARNRLQSWYSLETGMYSGSERALRGLPSLIKCTNQFHYSSSFLIPCPVFNTSDFKTYKQKYCKFENIVQKNKKKQFFSSPKKKKKKKKKK